MSKELTELKNIENKYIIQLMREKYGGIPNDIYEESQRLALQEYNLIHEDK